jgi:hypothetical protein
VNAHFDRVLTDGADPSTINLSWLTQVDNWLIQNNLEQDLLFWTDPAFGVKRNGNVIQKVYDLGTTRLPRGGDYTPLTSNTTYTATGINGSAPAWVNGNSSAAGYYGNGRVNTIQRQRQITVAAVYQRTDSTIDSALFGSKGYGTSGGVESEDSQLSLMHKAGTPGTINFNLSDGIAVMHTASVPASTAAVQIAAGTYDGAQMLAYSNGVAGSPNSALNPNTNFTVFSALKGFTGDGGAAGFYSWWGRLPVLGSGSHEAMYDEGDGSYAPVYDFPDHESMFNASDLIVLDKALTAAQVTSLTALLNAHVSGSNPPPPPPPPPSPPPPPPPPTPPPPPPPPVPPTVTLSVNPTTITVGQSATLTWSATNASSCTGTNFTGSGTSGSTSVSPTVTTMYSITCVPSLAKNPSGFSVNEKWRQTTGGWSPKRIAQ